MEGSINASNLAVTRQLYGNFVTGEFDAIRDVLHPDVHARPSLDGGPELTGADAVLAWWKTMATAGADVEVRPLDYEVRDNCVIVRGYLRHRDGRMLTERTTYWLHELRDGRVIRMESHPTREAALASV